MRVQDLMTRDIVTVPPDKTALRAITAHPSDLVEQAAREMHERRIGCLPVVSDEGELVGIVTASDILRASVRFWEAVSTMRSIFSPAG